MNNFTLPFEEPIAELEERIEELRSSSGSDAMDSEKKLADLEEQRSALIASIYAGLCPWDRVRVARHQNRPSALDYVRMMFGDFTELHGDRRFQDDQAIVTGLGRLGKTQVVLVAHQRGRTTKEKLECNFGMANPEGFRKALRVMKLAEKFRLPIVTLIDTMGAYPGVGSEERGVAYAIAENLLEMARLRTPIVSVVIGEGGSGGALGIGLADRLGVMEYAYYSVISPEGCAGILWRTAEKAPEAARSLRLTAQDLLELGVIDSIIPEPPGGAHRAPETAAKTLERVLLSNVADVRKLPIDRLLENRYQKYRQIGTFSENGRKVTGSLLRAQDEL